MHPLSLALLGVTLAGIINISLASQIYTVYIASGYYGTTSTVKLRITGNLGTTQTFFLIPPGGKFTSYGIRRFTLTGRNVGTVSRIDIAAVTPNSGPAWTLSKVLVRVGSKPSLFRYDNSVGTGWVTIQLKCARGYKLSSGVCKDINECTTGSPCKGPLATCRNTLGSYRCECPKGYWSRWNQICEDTDECKLGTGCEHKCVNTPGSYHCACNAGYKVVDGYKCRDLDECAEGKDKCDHATTTCVNRDIIATGKDYLCPCKPGYRPATSRRCVVNYCRSLPSISLSSYSPPKCAQNQQNRYGDKCTLVCIHGYVPNNPAHMIRTCGPKGEWNNYGTQCAGRMCPPLAPIKNGEYLNPECLTVGGRYRAAGSTPDSCVSTCNNGYEAVGSGRLTCQADGTWKGSPVVCNKIYPDPRLNGCPISRVITVSLEKGKTSYAFGDKWKDPTSNNNITVKPAGANGFYRFPYGDTKVTWTATNEVGKKASCSVVIRAKDNEPPTVVYCPGPVIYYPTTASSGKVPYKKPIFTDNLGVKSVTPAYTGGYHFRRGVNVIRDQQQTFTAMDTSSNYNKAYCTFDIVYGGHCHVPDSVYRGSWKCQEHGNVHVRFCQRLCPAGSEYFESLKHNYFTCGSRFGDWKYVASDCVATVKVKANETCPAGYIKATFEGAVNTKCYECPIGKYEDKGQCKKCPSGTHQEQGGQTSCKKCPAGMGSSDEAIKCKELCPAGTFSANGIRPFCQLCAPAHYQPVAGSSKCIPCALATNTKYGATKCGVAAEPSAPGPVIERVVSPGNLTEDKNQTLECYIRDSAITPVSVVLKIEGNVPASLLGYPKKTEITNKAGKAIGVRLVLRQSTRYDARMKYVCEATNPHGVTQTIVPLDWVNPYERK